LVPAGRETVPFWRISSLFSDTYLLRPSKIQFGTSRIVSSVPNRICVARDSQKLLMVFRLCLFVWNNLQSLVLCRDLRVPDWKKICKRLTNKKIPICENEILTEWRFNCMEIVSIFH
jgi:hypothetical protein